MSESSRVESSRVESSRPVDKLQYMYGKPASGKQQREAKSNKGFGTSASAAPTNQTNHSLGSWLNHQDSLELSGSKKCDGGFL